MNIKRAKNEIKNTLKAYLTTDEFGAYRIPPIRQRPILLMGPPGIGKTQIMQQIAEETGVGLVSYTLTHHTRQSALGLPFIDKVMLGGEERTVTAYTMSEIIASVYREMERTGVKEGIDNTDNKQIELARVYDMTAFNTFRYVYLTGVYPYITAQLKVAAGMCFKAGISAEIIGLVTGTIGTQMYYAKMYLLSAELFSWSIVVIVVSLVIEKCIIWLAKMLYKCIQHI